MADVRPVKLVIFDLDGTILDSGRTLGQISRLNSLLLFMILLWTSISVCDQAGVNGVVVT